VFAQAHVNGLRFVGLEYDGFKFGAFVISVAQWLALRQTASAVSIFLALLKIDFAGAVTGNLWLIHSDHS
jgi:hypothetical protein